MLEYHQY